MEKNVEISLLWQMYGKLLTQKQNEYIDYYYNKDLSLSEIAENENITRQGVRDIIKKGERKLFEYEEKLLFTKYCADRGYNMTNLFRQFMNSKIAEIPQEERDAFLEQKNEWKNN